MTATTSSIGRGKNLCGAKKRQGEGCCKRPAGWGTDHAGTGTCKLHGGKTRNHVTAAVEEQARQVLARLDVAAVENPLTVLAELTGQSLAWRDVIAEKVNELGNLRYQTEHGEQLRAEIALFERAMDRCAKFAVEMARLNIDERLAKVTERQTEIVAGALAAALGEMGLSPEEQRDARNRVARHLRSVA
jgi:hypothetical protein